MNTRTLLPVAGFFCALTLAAADWPQWRGPDRTDVSKETGLLKTWPKPGPKLLWTDKDTGTGFSGPAIVGPHLYTLGGDGEKEYVYAFDIGGTTPKKAWTTEVGTFFQNGNGDGPRATPTVDGEVLYVMGGHGDLNCIDTASGKKLWHVNMKSDLRGRMMSGWGYTESPLVDDDKVVCTPGGPQGTLAALDKKTSTVVWRSKDFTDAAAYSSLIVAKLGGVRQYVVMTGKSVAGVAADNGRLLWQYERPSRTAAVPTPIVSGDYVYVASGYGVGCTLIKVSAGENSSMKAEKVYDNKSMVNHHGGVVLVGDYLYGYSDGKGWVCENFKTGKNAWESKKLGKGSITYADGRLYCYSENNGTLVLIDASPKGWQERGRFKIPQESNERPGGRVWTHPVIANGRLYLRDQELLFCYDVKGSERSARK